VERELESGSGPLLRAMRWASWGQPVQEEMRPALLLAAEVCGMPYAPWRQIREAMNAE